MLITTSNPSRRTARRAIVGELDLATENVVLTSLKDAVTEGHRRLEVDLSGITFMDCSGIRVLLLAQRFASESHVRFTLGDRSQAVDRMLNLTNLAPLFPDLPDRGGVEPLAAR